VKNVEKPCHDQQFIRENYEMLIALSQNVVNVLHEKAQKADFEHEGGQVVVEKQCTLHEEVRNEIDHVAEEQRESDVLKFHPFLVVQIDDLSTSP
jgi:hypothetical protein